MNAALRRQQALREGNADTLAEPLTPVDEAGFVKLDTPLSSGSGASGGVAVGVGGVTAPYTPTQELEDATREQRGVARRAYSLRTDDNACMFPLLSLMSEETRLVCLSAVRFRTFTKGQRILRRGDERVI